MESGLSRLVKGRSRANFSRDMAFIDSIFVSLLLVNRNTSPTHTFVCIIRNRASKFFTMIIRSSQGIKVAVISLFYFLIDFHSLYFL
jgi:hypothetical protein